MNNAHIFLCRHNVQIAGCSFRSGCTGHCKTGKPLIWKWKLGLMSLIFGFYFFYCCADKHQSALYGYSTYCSTVCMFILIYNKAMRVYWLRSSCGSDARNGILCLCSCTTSHQRPLFKDTAHIFYQETSFFKLCVFVVQSRGISRLSWESLIYITGIKWTCLKSCLIAQILTCSWRAVADVYNIIIIKN